VSVRPSNSPICTGTATTTGASRPPRTYRVRRSPPGRTSGRDVPSSHLEQLRELVVSMRAGVRPRSSGADGRTSLELITALYKSGVHGHDRAGRRDRPRRPLLHGAARRRPRLGACGARGRCRRDRLPYRPCPRRPHHGDRTGHRRRGCSGYVYRPEAAWEAPKPYLHPIRTLAGDVVTTTGQRPPLAQGPAVHRLASVGSEPVGGNTYVHGEGYLQLPERVGSMAHVAFDEIDIHPDSGSGSGSDSGAETPRHRRTADLAPVQR